MVEVPCTTAPLPKPLMTPTPSIFDSISCSDLQQLCAVVCGTSAEASSSHREECAALDVFWLAACRAAGRGRAPALRVSAANGLPWAELGRAFAGAFSRGWGCSLWAPASEVHPARPGGGCSFMPAPHHP